MLTVILTGLLVASWVLAGYFLWELARWHDRAMASQREVWGLLADLEAAQCRIGELVGEFANAPAPVVFDEDAHWSSLIRDHEAAACERTAGVSRLPLPLRVVGKDGDAR